MMRLFTAALALTLAVGLPDALSSMDQGKTKPPIPGKDALDRAAALIDELFRADLANSKADREAQLRLAQRFLFEARDTHDDPAGKFVLLRRSADLAAQAGDAGTALLAHEELAHSFEMAAEAVLELKISAFETASLATATPDAYQGIVDAALALLEEAVAADDYASAAKLGLAAENAAKKLKSVPLVSAIRKRNEAVAALQTDYAQIKPFVDKLKKDPGDAKANYEAGLYFALTRGNWEKGLPLLAKGSDAGLKNLATLDMSDPQGFHKTTDLAEGWAKAAGGQKGQAKTNAFLRSYHWCLRAHSADDANDKDRANIQVSMQAVNAQLPVEQRVGEIAVELRRFAGHNGPVFGVALSADGSKMASCGTDGVVRLWDAKTSKELRRLDGQGGPVWAIRISADGRHVVSGGFDKSIRIWDWATGREIRRLSGHGDYIRAVALSGDGRFILSGGDDRVAKLWDAGSGSESKTLAGHDHFVFGVAVSRDGKRGLTASLDRTIRHWNLESGAELHTLSGHGDTVLGVQFTPDSRRALSASTDKTLRLWDLGSGQPIHVFKGHTGYVLSVAVSPDGRRALSGGQDGKVILWDVDSGKLLRVLEGHAGPVWSVAFSGDGRFAASAGNDGTIRLWSGTR